MSSLLLPVYKLRRKNTQAENTCRIIFEKAKGRAWWRSKQRERERERLRWSFRLKGFYKKGAMRNFAKFTRKQQAVLEFLFFDKFRRWSVTSLKTKHKNRCFLENFAKFASDYRNTNSSERGTGNGTVIYDTKIQTY